jgi:hypothetical protein
MGSPQPCMRGGSWPTTEFQWAGKYLQGFAHQHATAADCDCIQSNNRKPFQANVLRRGRIVIRQLGMPLPTLWHGGCFKSIQRRTAERQPSGWNRKSHVSKEVCLLQTTVRLPRRDGPSWPRLGRVAAGIPAQFPSRLDGAARISRFRAALSFSCCCRYIQALAPSWTRHA